MIKDDRAIGCGISVRTNKEEMKKILKNCSYPFRKLCTKDAENSAGFQIYQRFEKHDEDNFMYCQHLVAIHSDFN